MKSLAEVLDSIGTPRLLVFGDLILDRYTWGDAERVSPEAPVLVLAADQQDGRLGGAASAASLLRGLDAQVSLAGIVGDDSAGETIGNLLAAQTINWDSVLCDRDRPTTTKERFIGRAAGRHPHQILRVDREQTDPIDPHLEALLAKDILARLPECQAVLISDYNKGICTPGLLAAVITAAAERSIPVLVDPARITDYGRYQGATILAPNRIEAQLATGRKIETSQDAQIAGRQLCEMHSIQTAVVKLDSDGMVLVTAEGAGLHVPTLPREVHDVTGAGDMVLAVLGLGLAVGVPLDEAARLANVAAGLEVQRLGVVPVSRAEIRSELEPRSGRARPRAREKLVTLEDMAYLADVYRRAGKKVVLTNGCFDLLHAGHVAYLEESARLGDVLVVAINSDRSVRRLKGPDRPVTPQRQRSSILASLAVVDHVLIFDEDTPHNVLRQVRPDVLVKGGDYTADQVVGWEIVLAYGGRVSVVTKTEEVSTTAILASVSGDNCGRCIILGIEDRPKDELR